MLIIFSGLPGSGKSSLAQALASHLQAVYLRIDTVEAALHNLGSKATVEGYAVAYALAEDNLRLGRVVVADCVNPLALTREAWYSVAVNSASEYQDIHVTCSDPVEHRRRVEERRSDVRNHAGQWMPPTWDEVQSDAPAYAPWTTSPLTIDTAQGTQEENFTTLLGLLAEGSSIR